MKPASSQTPPPANGRIFRKLSHAEISRLEEQGCRCDDWGRVSVADPFLPERYRMVEFIGDITLGTASAIKEFIEGVPCRCGIYNAVVAHCNIGDNVYINNVTGALCRLDIGDDVRIEASGPVICRGRSCFGNDVKVNVMSETGGREVNIHTRLTAPMAYLQAFYRHDILLSKALVEGAARIAEESRSDRGRIGHHCEITGCGEITDVDLHHGSVIRGASRLTNGTVAGGFVGSGVIAEDFIILEDAKVDSGAILHGAFIGHSAKIGSGFTAHDSLIFTNSTLDNGESAAMFAGPFTASMHKSTLLIGGLFSFFNAGSGTNQSNHLYKLGPMHQGTTARGCKTGSDTYILWPAAIGPFTAIMGRHYSHPDTRRFPFSYLINDQSGRSILLPAAAAATVGLARDVEKWPERISGAGSRDNINFHWLSPYTMQPVLDGLTFLEEANEEDKNEDKNLQDKNENREIEYRGVFIPRRAMLKGIRLYRLLVRLYTGGVLRRKMLAVAGTNPEITSEGLLEVLRLDPGEEGTGNWVDLAGILAPRRSVDRITRDFAGVPDLSGASAPSLSTLDDALTRLSGRYHACSWSWTWHNLPRLAGVSAAHLSIAEAIKILSRGAEAARELETLFIKDAAKEYDPETASTGFGIDAGDNYAEIRGDFDRARGSLASQRFLAMLHRRVLTFTSSTDNLISILSGGAEQEN